MKLFKNNFKESQKWSKINFLIKSRKNHGIQGVDPKSFSLQETFEAIAPSSGNFNMLNTFCFKKAVIVVMVFLEVSCHGVSVIGSYGMFVFTETVFKSAFSASNIKTGIWTWA